MLRNGLRRVHVSITSAGWAFPSGNWARKCCRVSSSIGTMRVIFGFENKLPAESPSQGRSTTEERHPYYRRISVRQDHPIGTVDQPRVWRICRLVAGRGNTIEPRSQRFTQSETGRTQIPSKLKHKVRVERLSTNSGDLIHPKPLWRLDLQLVSFLESGTLSIHCYVDSNQSIYSI